MRVSRFVRTFGPLTALATAAAGLVVAPAAHSAGDVHYVSMGDSYSAASGVLPLSSSPWNPECTQVRPELPPPARRVQPERCAHGRDLR